MSKVIVSEQTAEVGDPLAKPARGRAGEPAAGERIGRYTVLEVLGRGGMGVVVSAYDPKLDRRVAVKLIKPDELSRREELHARLLREARAMAKIRDPHVVSVYEVGEHEEHVYLAMEQVEGGTLRDELRELGSATWRHVVELFVSAGRGLAAAHEAGVVHRDFKPENVFVDRDKRVLVGDFGLAGAHVANSTSGLGDAPLDERLTRADVVIGTPAYMAPEQHRDKEIDARADQFAFCVALYEALYGARPFAGETTPAYIDAVLAGSISDPPAGRKVPEWLRKVLVRGLSPRAEDRFASMRDLLAELGADPARARGHGRGARAVAVVVGGGFWLTLSAAIHVLELDLGYAHFHLRNAAFLALAAAVVWIGRSTFARTEHNRRIVGFGLAAATSLVVLSAGAQLMALPLDALAALHLLVAGMISAVVAVTLDPRFTASALVYTGGFFVTAATDAYSLSALLGHATLVATLFVVFVGKGRAETAG